ncbi:hypothetical protein DM50_3241 [Burkholderia mallei]|nr:hypothetical protein DM50_3241 [Burkholderia mallei]
MSGRWPRPPHRHAQDINNSNAITAAMAARFATSASTAMPSQLFGPKRIASSSAPPSDSARINTRSAFCKRIGSIAAAPCRLMPKARRARHCRHAPVHRV